MYGTHTDSTNPEQLQFHVHVTVVRYTTYTSHVNRLLLAANGYNLPLGFYVHVRVGAWAHKKYVATGKAQIASQYFVVFLR